MLKLPNFKKSFEYENNFYLSCDSSRIAKVLAHYELFKMIADIPGAIVECGVFKGASLIRFAMFRELFTNNTSKKIIGFDAFGKFPKTAYAEDKKFRKRFIDTSGIKGISTKQLFQVLQNKSISRGVELIQGDVSQTVPDYLKKNPELKISLLNMDTDIYEPAVTILNHLYPRLSRGGIILLDDYGVFPGETKAVDEYFKNKKAKIRKLPFCTTPCYIVKKD